MQRAAVLFSLLVACSSKPGSGSDGSVDSRDGGASADGCAECVEPTPEDLDGDTVDNDEDNCPDNANPDQRDGDGDGSGDACDNCPAVANFDQRDSDNDGLGDACAEGDDQDGDGVPDTIDNCSDLANPEQSDGDADGSGDLCDNCPFYANADQADEDNDGVGDTCQSTDRSDPDGDGVEGSDNCPNVSNDDQADGDEDGIGNACDNCPDAANPFQEDLDTNGIGDHCDPDFTIPPGTPICAEGTTASRRLASNIYVLMDLSTSMLWEVGSRDVPSNPDDSRWRIVTAAVDGASDELAAGFNIGIGGFPARCENQNGTYRCEDQPSACSATSLPDPILPTQGGRDGMVLRDAYGAITPFGTTPTAMALEQVRTKRSYEIAGDPFAADRANAVVLITDGEPNSVGGRCNTDRDLDDTVDAAAALAAIGVPVYVIGIEGVNESAMESIAVAGGGNNPDDANRTWFPAGDVNSLTAALRRVAEATVSCAVALTPTGDDPPDWGRASVVMHIDDSSTHVPSDDYEVSEGDPTTIQLRGGSCMNLQAAAQAESDVSVDVRVACPSECSGDEVCGDNADNDCDGEIDEDCPASCRCIPEFEDCGGGCPTECVPRAEQCDGADNDCDEEIDEGCCVPEEEVCDGIDNDCDGRADEGCDPVLI